MHSAGPASTMTTTTKVLRKVSVHMSLDDLKKLPSHRLKATVSSISSATSDADDATPIVVFVPSATMNCLYRQLDRVPSMSQVVS